MIKRHRKRLMGLILAWFVLLTPGTAFAQAPEESDVDGITATPSVEPESETDEGAGADTGMQSTEVSQTKDEADDNVVIEEDDKPYLALGADLSPEQQATVLSLMGIASWDLGNYDVSYVTNTEEHTYLDAYISKSEIGSKSWSSVVIVKREKGSGINISTKNINYCTIGMYKNALVTAGIKDADIIVAGPRPISGTAALVGIFKAYTDMTGSSLSKESIDTALNELVLTGKLSDIEGVESEDVESMVAYLKQKVAEGALKDEKSIGKAIEEACDDFSVSLSDEEKSQLIELMLKIKDLDLDVDSLLDQAKSIYDKLSNMGFDVSSGDGLIAKIGDFFSGIVDAIKDFFSGLFS